MGIVPREREGIANENPLNWITSEAVYVVRDSYDERDAKPVMSERDSFVRISVTDADDHTTQQITESRTHSFCNRV